MGVALCSLEGGGLGPHMRSHAFLDKRRLGAAEWEGAAGSPAAERCRHLHEIEVVGGKQGQRGGALGCSPVLAKAFFPKP